MFYRPHARVIAPVGQHSMTKQSHKQECDINLILKQYQKTGLITHITKNQPKYIDLPDQGDYQSSLQILREAENAFASLPAKVRDHFDNDAANFLAAFNDDRQIPFLREMGLLRPLPAPLGASPTSGTPEAPPAAS